MPKGSKQSTRESRDSLGKMVDCICENLGGNKRETDEDRARHAKT